MLFNSVNFLIFFPIVALLYRLIPARLRYLWLLGASYFFYMCWNAKYALLLASSTLITWGCSMLLTASRSHRLRTAALAGCIAANLGILFYFKYFGFFLSNLNRFLAAANLRLLGRSFDVLLPVGISFYIFQALGYTVDVYRGRTKAEKNVLRYALFVSFFPQLVAGPIERSDNLLGQLRELDTKRPPDLDETAGGLFLMCWGLFLKMVIADRVALLVNTVFDNYYMAGSVALGAGAVGFALQIYCDFCGYSTIAVGAAKVFGIRLMENFDTPYFAVSVSDFWRRWHISLSTWLRDYVYIPLGGSRCGRLQKYRNLLVTFLISGLWHGAAWNYVVWGLLHGVYQVAGDLTRPLRQRLYRATKARTESGSFRLAQILCTFLFVDVAWIFFRAGSLSVAVDYCRRLVTGWDPWSLGDGSLYRLGLSQPECGILNLAVLLLLVADILRFRTRKTLDALWSSQGLWFRWIAVWALMFACLVWGVYGVDFDSSQFIYFQF